MFKAFRNSTPSQLFKWDGNITLNAPVNQVQFCESFERRLKKTISESSFNYSSGEINEAMKCDLNRINYFINGQPVCVPYSKELSLEKFILTAQQLNAGWLDEHLPLLSTILHQGLMVDILDSINYWETARREKLPLKMVSTDSKNNTLSIYINISGEIKFIVAGKINNIITEDFKVLCVDRYKSEIVMQITFLLIRGQKGSGMFISRRNPADHAQLRLYNLKPV